MGRGSGALKGLRTGAVHDATYPLRGSRREACRKQQMLWLSLETHAGGYLELSSTACVDGKRYRGTRHLPPLLHLAVAVIRSSGVSKNDCTTVPLFALLLGDPVVAQDLETRLHEYGHDPLFYFGAVVN